MRRSTIVQFVLISAIIVVMIQIGRTSIKTYQSGQRVEQLEEEIADIQQQNSKLRRVLADRDTNAFVEMVARNKLNFMKPGESLYIVVNDEGEDNQEDAAIEQLKDMTPLSHWKLLLLGIR